MEKEKCAQRATFTEQGVRIAVEFATRPVFTPTTLRSRLGQGGRFCYVAVSSDQVDGKKSAVVFSARPQFHSVTVSPLTGVALEQTLHSYLNANNGDPKFHGVTRHGLVVACAGLDLHVCQMISGIVAEVLLALSKSTAIASSEEVRQSA